MTTLMTIGLVLWGIIICGFLLFGILFVRQSVKYGEEARVKILAFVGFFLILIGISRLFHPFLATLDPANESIFFPIGQITLIAALIMIVFYVERQVFKASHHALTIFLCIGEVLYIIDSVLFSFILIIAMIVSLLFILILYLRLAIISSGEPQRDAWYVIVGVICFACSYLVYGLEDVLLTPNQLGIITAVAALISLPFLLKGFRFSL